MYTPVLRILAAGPILAIGFCNRIWLEHLILARMLILGVGCPVDSGVCNLILAEVLILAFGLRPAFWLSGGCWMAKRVWQSGLVLDSGCRATTNNSE